MVSVVGLFLVVVRTLWFTARDYGNVHSAHKRRGAGERSSSTIFFYWNGRGGEGGLSLCTN